MRPAETNCTGYSTFDLVLYIMGTGARYILLAVTYGLSVRCHRLVIATYAAQVSFYDKQVNLCLATNNFKK